MRDYKQLMADADRQFGGRRQNRNSGRSRIASLLSGISLAPLALAGLLSQPGVALAQTSASTIEEVVVTARRREENLQDVPISVTALSPETLERANVSSSTDLIKLVPTLSVQQGATGPGTNYSLRGIRTGVVVYFNEVPTASVGVDDQIWDLSSVQAVAGPQGTLFGRNSTGGLILFVPKRPTDTLEGYVEASVGNYNFRQATAVVNMPFTDNLKVRVGARMIRRDGVVKNIKGGPDFQGLNRNALRLSVLFDPTENISNYTVLTYNQRDEKPYALIASGWTRNAGCLAPAPAACLPGYTRGQLAAAGDAQQALGIRSTSTTLPANQDSKTYGISNVFNWSLLENLTLKYVAGYRRRDSDEASSKANLDFPVQFGANHIFAIHDLTHEVQLQGDLLDDRLSWTAGYFRSRNKGFTGLTYALLLPPGGLPTFANSTSNRSRTLNRSEAFYGQATFAVTDALKLTAGARHTKDKAWQANTRRAPQFTFAGPNVCTLPVGAIGVDLVNCVRTLSDQYSATTYNLSADYRISEDLLVYVTTRRGYNGGGFNASVPDTATPGAPLSTYDPEEITDYEAGIKGDFTFGGAPLRINLSVFKAKYTGIQRNQRGFSVTGALYSGTANGPKATIKGLQFESVIRPVEGLTVSANYAYLYTRYDTGTNGFSQFNKFGQAPKHTVNLGATYSQPISAGGELFANANYAYQSRIAFQDDQSASAPGVFQDGYGIVDLRVGWREVADSKFDVEVFAKNAADKAYAIERQDLTGLFGFTGTVYSDPRTYGVEVRYRF